jgi:hypothetical protein
MVQRDCFAQPLVIPRGRRVFLHRWEDAVPHVATDGWMVAIRALGHRCHVGESWMAAKPGSYLVQARRRPSNGWKVQSELRKLRKARAQAS